jgi:hypothetical protein
LIVFPQQWTIPCLLNEGAKAWKDWLTTNMAKCVQSCLGGATKKPLYAYGISILKLQFEN